DRRRIADGSGRPAAHRGSRRPAGLRPLRARRFGTCSRRQPVCGSRYRTARHPVSHRRPDPRAPVAADLERTGQQERSLHAARILSRRAGRTLLRRRSATPDRNRPHLGPLRPYLHLRFRDRPPGRARPRRRKPGQSAGTVMAERPATDSAGMPLWGHLPASTAVALLRDLPIVVAALALFYGLLALTHYWTQPVNTQPPLHLTPGALPLYALYSLARILVAYFLSLVFAIVYGQIAAHNAKAERILIPLLDTLQSIPVLSFLPPVMAAMVALFPTRQFGVELGSILLIFTGQVWNMAFSVYSSTKNIPHGLVEAAQVFRLNWWQRFTRLEMPCAAIGLVWNSMMSVAGGWFFLMACEAFVLGNSVRLPGLGSYLQTAADNADMRSIVWGLATMIAVIVLMDQLLWRPIIAWAEKFKLEQVEAAETPRSPILTLLRRSRVLAAIGHMAVEPARERIDLYFAKKQA